MLSRLYR